MPQYSPYGKPGSTYHKSQFGTRMGMRGATGSFAEYNSNQYAEDKSNNEASVRGQHLII